jgi:hypothetical protein
LTGAKTTSSLVAMKANGAIEASNVKWFLRTYKITALIYLIVMNTIRWR